MNGFVIPEIIVSSPWEVEELIGNATNSTKPPCNEFINRRLKQKLLKKKLTKTIDATKTAAVGQRKKSVQSENDEDTRSLQNSIATDTTATNTRIQLHGSEDANKHLSSYLDPLVTNYKITADGKEVSRKSEDVKNESPKIKDKNNNKNNNNNNNNEHATEEKGLTNEKKPELDIISTSMLVKNKTSKRKTLTDICAPSTKKTKL